MSTSFIRHHFENTRIGSREDYLFILPLYFKYIKSALCILCFDFISNQDTTYQCIIGQQIAVECSKIIEMNPYFCLKLI